MGGIVTTRSASRGILFVTVFGSLLILLVAIASAH